MVRGDLPYGVTVAQVAHAAAESTVEYYRENSTWPDGMYCIVLSVPGEPELLALGERLQHHDIPHVLFREPDMLRLDGTPAATAIGLHPGPKSDLKKLLSGLPLLKGQKPVEGYGAGA